MYQTVYLCLFLIQIVLNFRYVVLKNIFLLNYYIDLVFLTMYLIFYLTAIHEIVGVHLQTILPCNQCITLQVIVIIVIVLGWA